jgi:nicotinamide mononucleotide transporter
MIQPRIRRCTVVSWMEIAAVITGFVCVTLTVRESVWAWPVGLVNAVLYLLVFYEVRLYADMSLQVVYLVMGVYGWYRWARPVEAAVLPITTADPLELVSLVLFGIATTTVWGWYLAHHTDASLPYVDAALVAASLSAQWLLTRKKIENWVVWIVADIAYVGMFVIKDLWLTAGLYVAFTVLATIGLVRWYREYRA